MADVGKPLKPGTGEAPGPEPKRREEKGKPAPKKGQELAADYGVSWAVIQSDPGLMAWFNDFAKRFAASQGKITQQAFTLELQKQPWWRDHSANYIRDLQQELENPKDYEQSLATDLADLRGVANSMGAELDDAALGQLARQKRRAGWGAEQVRQALAGYIDVSGDMSGQAGNAQDELMLWAKRNGLTLSPSLIGGYVQRVAKGELTVDDVKGDLRKTYMAGAYPGWADKIAAGFDVADLAVPYQEAAQTLLEDRSIGLDDPLMKKMLQSVGPDGKPVTVPLYEAEKMIRADKRWQTTDNAYSMYADAADHILSTWGFR